MSTISSHDNIADMLDEHPSLAASLEDFEHSERDIRSPVLEMPSCHSGFRSEYSETESEQQTWAPPAWRKAGSGWFRNSGSRHATESGSRHSTPFYESADEGDLTLPANVPLPSSPQKGRSPRESEEPGTDAHANGEPTLGEMGTPALTGDDDAIGRDSSGSPPENANNCKSRVAQQ
jgi:hypothetical protein